MSTIDLDVQGMSCGSCVRHVAQALQALPGLGSVDVDVPTGRVRLSGALENGSEAAIAALSAAGYPAQLAVSPPAAQPLNASGCHRGGATRGACCCG